MHKRHTQATVTAISGISAVFYERCFFETLHRQQWKEYANLGSVLDAQLVLKGKATRCTQTNWKWAQMAARWRNAKIIQARDLTISDTRSERGKKALLEKMIRELKEVRAVTSNDKTVDTVDLDFDPVEVPAEYSCPVSSHHSRRSSFMKEKVRFYANRWRVSVDSNKLKESNKTSLESDENNPTSLAKLRNISESDNNRDFVPKKQSNVKR